MEAGHVDTEVHFQFLLIQGLLLAAGLATTAPRAFASPLFAAPFISFDTGINPSSVAVGDLNADGKPDLRASRGSSSRSGDSWAVRPLI